MPAMLQVRDLSKSFGRIVTADHISFELTEGRALGVVGPNGAGKSTLMSMISGVLPQDQGEIHFSGQNLNRVSAGRRTSMGIARTFQIPRPFGQMTVFENAYVGAAFGAGLTGQAGYDAAHAALVQTGLERFCDTPARALRLLDRKKLELARALATKPRLILLDEIAGGLTDKELPSLIGTIKDLRAAGITVVWIEHIVHALLQVVDELMCLAIGKVVAHGEPAQVMTDPAVIETYLGSTVDTEVHQ
jgi:branched-chain amino acid transport system ATP-binding protein